MVEQVYDLGVVAVNHLLMHIYPKIREGGMPWIHGLNELRGRIDQFNGRRVFGIVTGAGLADAEEVKSIVGDLATDFVVLPNRSELREVMTFPNMIEKIKGEPGNFFYCHSKGSTHDPTSICQDWRRAMWEVCLDFPQLVECMLERFPTVGGFRRFEGLGVDWHFSGSFYWMRLADLWKRNWGDIEQVWYGIESYPCRQFSRQESGCLFLDACKDLYEKAYWDLAVWPALVSWKRRMARCME